MQLRSTSAADLQLNGADSHLTATVPPCLHMHASGVAFTLTLTMTTTSTPLPPAHEGRPLTREQLQQNADAYSHPTYYDQYVVAVAKNLDYGDDDELMLPRNLHVYWHPGVHRQRDHAYSYCQHAQQCLPQGEKNRFRLATCLAPSTKKMERTRQEHCEHPTHQCNQACKYWVDSRPGGRNAKLSERRKQSSASKKRQRQPSPATPTSAPEHSSEPATLTIVVEPSSVPRQPNDVCSEPDESNPPTLQSLQQQLDALQSKLLTFVGHASASNQAVPNSPPKLPPMQSAGQSDTSAAADIEGVSTSTYDQLQHKLIVAEAQIVTLTQSEADLLSEQARLRREYDIAQDQLTAKNAELTNKVRQEHQLLIDVNVLRKQLTDNTQQLKVVGEQLEATQNQLEHVKAEVEVKQAANNALQSSNRRLSGRLALASTQLTEQSKQLQSAPQPAEDVLYLKKLLVDQSHSIRGKLSDVQQTLYDPSCHALVPTDQGQDSILDAIRVAALQSNRVCSTKCIRFGAARQLMHWWYNSDQPEDRRALEQSVSSQTSSGTKRQAKEAASPKTVIKRAAERLEDVGKGCDSMMTLALASTYFDIPMCLISASGDVTCFVPRPWSDGTYQVVNSVSNAVDTVAPTRVALSACIEGLGRRYIPKYVKDGVSVQPGVVWQVGKRFTAGVWLNATPVAQALHCWAPSHGQSKDELRHSQQELLVTETARSLQDMAELMCRLDPRTHHDLEQVESQLKAVDADDAYDLLAATIRSTAPLLGFDDYVGLLRPSQRERKAQRLLEEELKQQCADNSLRLETVAADGDCFFHAVTLQLKQSRLLDATATALSVRQAATDWLVAEDVEGQLKNWTPDHQVQLLQPVHVGPGEEVVQPDAKSYAAVMRTKGIWADSLAIEGTSRAYHVSIIVWQFLRANSKLVETLRFEVEDSKATLQVVNHDVGPTLHYDAVFAC